MKRFIVCTLAFAAIMMQSVSAQNKGDKYFGGTMGVGVSSTIIEGSGTTSTTVGIAPELGFFVADKFRIGVGLGYQANIYTDYATVHTVSVAPNIAYYVKLCDRFYYTPAFEFGFCYSRTDGLSGVGFGAGLSIVGFEFRPSQHFGLSVNLLSLSYAYLSYSDYDTSSHGVNFNLGINPSVGLKYYF